MLFQIKIFYRNLNDYISDKVDYVITDQDWNEDFDKVNFNKLRN